MGPKNGWRFWGKWGPNLRYQFRDHQKALPCAEPRRLTYFSSKSLCASWLQPFSRTKKQLSHSVPRGAKSRMRRTESPKPIWIKFCAVVDVTVIVTYDIVAYAYHRLRGFGGAGGSNFTLSHKLLSSPLQHSRTTVRACDLLFCRAMTVRTHWN